MLHNPYNSDYSMIPSPNTPYFGNIPNGAAVGKQISVSGEVTGDEFSINLLTPDATAFHFNLRIHQNCVVRNSFFGDEWGPEERDGPQPFENGLPFEVIIKVYEEQFLIYVNGQRCFEYQHRMPFEEITNVEVNGDVHVKQIVFSGGQGHRTHKHVDNEVPFLQMIDGIYPGKMIQVIGWIPYDCARFEVNLQEGQSEADNISLHVSSRFDDPHTDEAVVVNNRHQGSWGDEVREHHSEFPFRKGFPFEMLILCQENDWKVAINGNHFIEMGNRNPYEHAAFLAVEGDVKIKSIREY